jgi:hypothetical protein
MTMGRPSDFTQEKADIICERIAVGESLRDICKDDEMPYLSAVFRWLQSHESFQDQYARAREMQADTYADDIVGIADDFNDDPNSRRVRIDARKWTASKLRPKKYGEKLDIDQNVTGKIEFVTVYEPQVAIGEVRSTKMLQNAAFNQSSVEIDKK